jgi:hypothetical protein
MVGAEMTKAPTGIVNTEISFRSDDIMGWDGKKIGETKREVNRRQVKN